MGKDLRGIVVFMYHALYRDPEELELIPPEERPYAVSVDDFRRQLDLLGSAELPLPDPGDVLGAKSDSIPPSHGVLLSFDDGHSSFYCHAFPLLKERGLRGIFFVSSDLVGGRPDFCTWDQLAEMSRSGMLVQSHGATHRFLSDLGDSESRRELAESKALIEEKTGTPVTAVSFPGGRYGEREIAAGRELGYRYFFSSKPGINSAQELAVSGFVKRMTVRQATSDTQILAMATGDPMNMAVSLAGYSFKALIRMVFGSSFYHFLYRAKTRILR